MGRAHPSMKTPPCQLAGRGRGYIWLLFNKAPLNGKQLLPVLAAPFPSEKIIMLSSSQGSGLEDKYWKNPRPQFQGTPEGTRTWEEQWQAKL